MSVASEITRIKNNISSAYTALDGKGATLPQIQDSANLANTIESIPTGGSAVVTEQALNLYDWEGTLLQSYTAAEAQALAALPNPSDCPMYTAVDHEFLLFQEWKWNIADIKAWLTNHAQGKLNVVAIYTTTDGQDHDYWTSPRGEGAALISRKKRGAASIGASSFYGYSSLTNISIPDGVSFIGSSAFQFDRALKFVNVPNSVSYIGNGAFNECNALKTINLSNGLVSIDTEAFKNCYSLIEIYIPESVTSIGTSAFLNCYSLVSANIPNSVTIINGNTFRACCSLPHIRIPANVTSIGTNAFESCRNLFDILLEGKPSLANTNALANTPATQKIYVPRENLSWFETETNWAATYYSRFVTIEDNIVYLELLGYNVDAYKGGAA